MVYDNIRKGYERVLRARLKDAMFFFEMIGRSLYRKG